MDLKAVRGGVVLPGEQLRLAINLRGMTLSEFAAYAQLPESTLSRAVNNQAVRPKTLVKITKALEVLPVVVEFPS